MEGFRDPFEVTPGRPLYPAAAGISSALVLDALCCIPALLVLLRQLLSPGAGVARLFSPWIAAALAIWVAVSTFWADDKFAAICFAAHFASAIALFWAMSQLAHSWLELRWVGAIAFGLLLVNISQGLVL